MSLDSQQLSQSGAQPLRVVLQSVRELTATIKEFCFAAADGGLLPGFAPGAHIKVGIGQGEIPDDWRAYSLINLEPEADCSQPQACYRIAVQYEAQGQGGSRFMHEQLKAGQSLSIQAPVNHFPLAEDEEAVVLIGGGIGVTPIISMASALQRAGRGFIFRYAVRSRELAVYLPQLQQQFGRELRLHCDDEPDTRLDLAQLVSHCNGKQPLYICGPGGMIGALRSLAEQAGWDDGRVHFELFGTAAGAVPEQAVSDLDAFEVELRSGQVLAVPAGRSLLEVLTEAGVEVVADCREGYCGLCTVEVLDVAGGEIDHRDLFLSESQRASGRYIQSCVSRARGRLKLNL